LDREAISKIIALVNEKEKVHYTEIAFRLMVSFPTAQRYAVLFSKIFDKFVEYRRGVIYRKQTIGLELLDDRTRTIALQQTIDTLNSKLNFVKTELKNLLENHINHDSIEEIRNRIKKILEEI